MIERTVLRCTVTLGCALLMAAAAPAQTTTPAPGDAPQAILVPGPASSVQGVVEPAEAGAPKPGEVRRRLFFRAGPGVVSSDANGVRQEAQDYQQRLRAQLADPKQREQLIAERMRQQRTNNPELARVLHLDAAGEVQLLTLLIDQQLASELRERPMQRGVAIEDVLGQEAVLYDQQLRDITKIIGAAQLDTYVDYERTRAARLRVQGFDAALPAELRLSNAQKDALVPLLYENDKVRYPRGPFGNSLGRIMADTTRDPPSLDAKDRRSQLLNALVGERMLRSAETADRTLAEQLPRILSPEQTQLYLQQAAQALKYMRLRITHQQRAAGIEPQELSHLEDDVPAPRLSTNVRLQVTVRVDGKELERTVTSVLGGPVSFDGPAGLVIEAEPSQLETGAEEIAVGLRFYERVRGARRMVGETFNTAFITNPKQTAKPQIMNSNGNLLRGRKAYLVESSVKLTFL